MKKKIRILLALLVFTLLLLATGCGVSVSAALQPMTVTFLKVGKADAIVIQNQEKTILIDTGEEDDGEEIVDFLLENGINQVDLMIITHFDKDHVGGSAAVLNSLPVAQIITPAYEGTNQEYMDFLAAADTQGIVPQRLTGDLSLTIADLHLLIEPPLSYDTSLYEGEYDNDFSLIVTITHGENRFLFAGDIENLRICAWLELHEGEDLTADFLKVPHHGVYSSALDEFFTAANPAYAVICDSDKNPADSKTLKKLKKLDTEVWETKDGNVTAVSDGVDITVSQS